jgi:hypothetical protein
VNLTYLVQTLQFICMNQSYNSEHFWSNMRKCILTICSYIVCVLHFWFPSIKDCDLLKKIQKITHINIMSSISLNVIFKRINFVIQKKLTMQMVAHLHVIYVWLSWIYTKKLLSNVGISWSMIQTIYIICLQIIINI